MISAAGPRLISHCAAGRISSTKYVSFCTWRSVSVRVGSSATSLNTTERYRSGPGPLLSEEFQALVLDEVLVVLDVQGRERDFEREAARRNPGVVLRARTPPALGVRGHLAPPR